MSLKGEWHIIDYNLYLEQIKKGRKGLNPFLDHFKITMTDCSSGQACFKMAVHPEYLQGAKMMQGGLIVALADEAIAHAIMTELGPDEGLTTIELKSNFLAGVASGELTAKAAVFKKGRSLIIGDCIVTSSEGKMICRVSATFMLLKTRETMPA